MIRNADINEISDGRFYELNDMVKIGCNDCEGCSDCCHDMEALMLDPMDIYRLQTGLGRSFENLLDQGIELTNADGLILPKMKMTQLHEGAPACSFLNKEGRCSIHNFRPGICRLFPMGRYYEDGNFKYFLQVNECVKKGRYKIRLNQWLDTEDLETYHEYIVDWHYFSKGIGEKMPLLTEESRRDVLTYILRLFYQASYQKGDFYPQFYSRLAQAKRALKTLL
jgi:uncharacterized protein